MAATPYVSVIVPVFEMPQLILTLEALERQSCSDFEVIVVDNGSATPLTRCQLGGYSRVRLVREPNPGSYRARNRGVAESRGKVLAFTDADCVPESTWLERGLDAIAKASPGFVAGHVDFTFERPGKPKLVELYDSVVAIDQQAFVERGFAATANLFMLRRVFDLIGQFDDSLYSGGDREWSQRAQEKHIEAHYCRQAVVSHPARSSLSSLLQRSRRVVGGYLAAAPGGAKDRLSKRMLEHGVVNPVRIFRRAYLRSERSLPRSLGALTIHCVVKFVQLLEMLRLRCGGASRR